MQALPIITNEDAFDALVADDEAVSAVLAHFQDALQFQGPFVRPERGSAIVAVGAAEVLKIMAPHDAELCRVEQACLRALDTQLPIPTARCLGAGTLEGWNWIRMSRLEGVELVDVWPTLDADDRSSLATQLGEALSILHGLEAPAVVPRLDWAEWKASRIPKMVGDQRAKGCSASLLEGLEEFVAEIDLSEGRRGWLHTEVMLEHLLTTRTPSGWRLTGLFDFEPSWVGPQDYEFASVGLFVSRGDRDVFREVQRAAGLQIDPRRLFGMAMLHRYANLGWYWRRLGGPEDPRALAETWFGAF